MDKDSVPQRDGSSDSSATKELGFIHGLRELHLVSMELSRFPDEDGLCRRAVEWGLETLGVDRMSIWFIDASAPEWIAGSWGTDEMGRLRDERHSRVRRDPIIAPQEFYEGRVPVLLYHDEPCYDDQRRVVGRGDKALAPLWDGKVMMGELAADNLLSSRPIDEQTVELLALLARHVAHVASLLRSKEALAAALEEKRLLLKELQHRTRNNLSIIAALAQMEEARASPSAQPSLRALHDRVEAFASLYSLLDSESGGELSLDKYLGRVLEGLSRGLLESRAIRLEQALEPMCVDMKEAASIGIILNELVTDAAKYAFPGGRPGTIRIALGRAQDEAQLRVMDDGVGLPEGFELGSQGGLGLGLVGILSRQLRGSFAAESASPGTSFVIRFPLSSAPAPLRGGPASPFG